MQNCYWELIDSFESWQEYERFKLWLKDQEEKGLVKKMRTQIVHGALEEVIYKCLQSGEKWRLLEPDPPFTGFWKPVDADI